MKVAFIVQRYGKEVNGGSEFLCRLIAEQMQKYWEIDILTSCALDYRSWHDHYPAGTSIFNGVTIKRFKVDFPRNELLFQRYCDSVLALPGTRQKQIRWAQEQGPYSSEFLRYLRTHQNAYDLFFFFTYLYGFTVFGLPFVKEKSILIPTAHDEPTFYLPIYREIFTSPKGLLFQTPEEEALVLDQFPITAPTQVVSVGISQAAAFKADQETLKRFNQVQAPFVLYLGRIDESKGCSELFDFFVRFRNLHPEICIQLVLAGRTVMKIPDHPDILTLGFVSESEKHWLLSNTQVLINPSPYESLSLVTLEAWNVATPVLVTEKSPVLKSQTIRSQGGLTYLSFEDFSDNLYRLTADIGLRKRFGRQGLEFVKNYYQWNRVEEKYLKFSEAVLKQISAPEKIKPSDTSQTNSLHS